MTLLDINIGGVKIINEAIRKEFRDQGHTLTGTAEQNIQARIVGHVILGLGLDYMKSIDEGIDKEDINWKMLPGLIKYFILRGVRPEEAKLAAVRTIKKWLSEGMSTLASKRFSKTGARQNFIESAFYHYEIDAHFSNGFDIAVDEQYHKTKSETV